MNKIYCIVSFIIFSCISPLLAQEAEKEGEKQKEAAIDFSVTDFSEGAGVYIHVDEEAKPKGGKRAYFKLVAKNLHYPVEAHRAGVEGRVFVEIVIDEEGKIISAKTPEGHKLGYGMDEEAIRVLKMTEWIPAKKGGKVVKQKMIIPVLFKLGK